MILWIMKQILLKTEEYRLHQIHKKIIFEFYQKVYLNASVFHF